MNKRIGTLIPFATLVFLGCAEFPEKYENVIDGGKIRPFAIVLEPPEAAPGDTVRVQLKMYDGGKSYSVAWELALNYQVNQGATSSPFPRVTEIVNMETSGRKFDVSEDGLEFSFVVPTGDRNPLRLTDLSPDILKAENEISPDEKTELRKLGIASLDGGLRKADLIDALDVSDSVANNLSPMVDGLTALVLLKARVSSPGFELDVTKTLSVRYSNRLESGGYLSNVNRNPVIDSIGLIHVHAGGITRFEEIGKHRSDTVFLATSSENHLEPAAFDTLKIVPGHSYFMISATSGAEQPYRSPGGMTHPEQLFFQWFYTNLDDTGSDWDDLIRLDNADRPVNQPVVPLKFPKPGIGLRYFAIRATVGDSRPEWGVMVSTGLDYKAVHGYIEYE